jgi:hypothetical protein
MFARKLRDGLLATAAAGALVLGMGIGAASAGTALSSLVYPVTLLEDNDAESIGTDSGSNGLLDVGDTFRGILQIQTFADGAGVGLDHTLAASSGNNTLTGIFEVEIKSRTLLFSGAQFGSVTSDVYAFTFGPTAAFEATYGTGAMVALYEDTLDDYNSGTGCTTGAGGTCEATVTNGTLWMVLGFGGEDGGAGADATTDATGDEGWRATGPEDPTVADEFATNANVEAAVDITGDGVPDITVSSGFSYNLSILQNLTGLTFLQVAAQPLTATGPGADQDGFIDFSGSGNIKGTQNPDGVSGDATNYAATSDLDASFRVKVPEPATLGIMGIGLLGLGAISRRRKRAA